MEKERELPEFSLMQRVKRRFFAMRNGAVADQMRRGGLNYRVNFGLNVPQIKEIAQEILSDPAVGSADLVNLADELWNNATTRESRLIAPMITPEDIMSEEKACQWALEAQTPEVADMLCHSLLRRLPFAPALVEKLMAQKDAMARYTALRLVLNMLMLNKIAASEARKAAEATVCAGYPSWVEGLARRIIEELEFLEG